MHVFHEAGPELDPFITNLQASKKNVSLSSVSCSSELTQPEGWGVAWKLVLERISSPSIRSIGNSLVLRLTSKVKNSSVGLNF